MSKRTEKLARKSWAADKRLFRSIKARTAAIAACAEAQEEADLARAAWRQQRVAEERCK